MRNFLKTRLVKPTDFEENLHPAVKFFRSLELKTIYQNLRNLKLFQPSLDLGCGDGYISSLLFDGQFSYGLDNNEAGDVQVAIKKRAYGKVLIASATDMPLRPNTLNTIFSNSVIEHIPDNDAVISEVSRVLRPGGKFVFTAPCHNFSKYLYVSSLLKGLGLGFLARFYIKKRNKMLNHYHLYSHSQWRKKLARYDLKLIKHSYYISPDALTTWDRIALEGVVRRLLDKHAIPKLAKKYQTLVEKYFHDDVLAKGNGACIFVIAQKAANK